MGLRTWNYIMLETTGYQGNFQKLKKIQNDANWTVLWEHYSDNINKKCKTKHINNQAVVVEIDVCCF